MGMVVPEWARTRLAWTKVCVGGALVFTLAGCDEEPSPSDAAPAASPDSGSTEATDGGACPEGAYLAWSSPGCGDQAPVPTCIYGTDACLAVACSCDGEDLAGCGSYDAPFRSLGSCHAQLQEGGQHEAGLDAGPEAALSSTDGQVTDGGQCPEGAYLAWSSPGCDDEEPEPTCIYGTDACVAVACSCDGEDIAGCGSYDAPFRALGSCDGQGDGG